ncbi:hypothetical protein [Amycolatopsis sp. H20-H5]|uniref:hypothetical protein n=1 Tax=Amycolatopsis sp. H20-H5 TaxID=3046309 RepID=UPI002DBECCD7|nr:hypothetical protein [Amycolatopsis sp. H20-H5]MEC3974983.1 hypothetical protein [Amycolatopsis sp. H20-H5]
MTKNPAEQTAGHAEIGAARLLLSRMGVTAEDLLADPADKPEMPTFDVYIPKVAATLSVTTARAYGSYWKHVHRHWGARRLDAVSASDIRALAEQVKANALVRRNSRGGRNAAEDFVAAVRRIYRRAEDDDLIDERANPARKVTKPPTDALHPTRPAEASGGTSSCSTVLSRRHGGGA